MKNLYFSLLPDAEKAKYKTEKQWFKLGFVPVSQDAGTIIYSNRFCTGKYRYLTSEEVRKATDEEMAPYREEQRCKRRSRYLQAKKEQEQAIRYGELLSLCDQQRQLDEENYRGTIPTLTVSIDIETTGLDFNQDEILQVSALDIDTGEVLLDSYVKPYFTEDWPEARRVNHITKEMYNDGSGSLHGPNSKRFYSYDLAPYATSGLIEYNATGKGYDTFEGSLDRFREWAEQQILQDLKKEPLQYQEFLEHQSHQDGEIEKNPLDMEDAARQAGLTVQRDQDKPGAAYFDADQNVIHVSDAGSEEDVRLSELKGYADAVIQRTATVEQPVRDLESASLAVMLAARYNVGVSDRLSQQLASAHAEAVKCPTFDLPVTLQRLDKALDYCDHFLAHEQERALEQEAENEPEPEQETELSPQSQAFMMDL